MKKSIILSFITVMTLGATSCIKDWQCQCTDGTITEVSGFFPNTKKSTAKKSCSDIENTFPSGVTCSVK